MMTGAVTVVAFIFFIFFIVYKKDMLIKMFSLNAALPANQFQQQLENTASIVVKRLEDQISHLEYLLQEADEKIMMLDERLQQTELFMKQDNKNEDSITQPFREISNTLETEADLLEKRQTEDIDQPQKKDMVNHDKRRLILAMADQGYNVTEIAKATSVGKGEVMLLLQLNKK